MTAERVGGRVTTKGQGCMRTTLIVAVFVLLVAACSGGEDDAAIGDGRDTVIELGSGDVVLTAGLVRFDDCGALLDHLHAESLARVGPYGFDDDGWSAPDTAIESPAEEAAAQAEAEAAAAAAPAEAEAEAAPAAAAAPVEGEDFSGTNVQEAGVDEADIVKTDGRRIFTVSSGAAGGGRRGRPQHRRLDGGGCGLGQGVVHRR